MVTIEISTIRSRIVGALTSEVLETLDKKLSYQVVSDYALFNNRFYRRPGNDGFDHRFDIKRQTFDTGLVPAVQKILSSHKVEAQVKDKRKYVPLGTPIPLSEEAKEANIVIRDYQQEAIEKALAAKQGLLMLATGAGKSLCIAAIVGHLNLKSVIFVHTKDLLYQMKRNIEFLLGVQCGQVGDSIVDIKQITVATMQTASRAIGKRYIKYDKDDWDDKKTKLDKKQKDAIKKMLVDTNTLVVDECHHANCKTLQTLARTCKNANYRYGASATLREDGADIAIYGALGQILHRISASELIEKGWLVPPTIYVYKMPEVTKVEDKGLDWHAVYKKRIVEHNGRNKLIAEAALQLFEKGKKVLILVKEIGHGNTIYELLENSEAFIRFIQGRDRDREEVLAQFKSSQLDILIATSLADEGLDLPILDAVILAGGGKSAVKALQRIGRTLRLYDGKDKAIVVDFLDSGKWVRQHSLKRISIYKREPKFTVKVLEPKSIGTIS